MSATLETRVKAGQPVLICNRCGWWAYYAKHNGVPFPATEIDAFPCPDCHAPLDAVDPRR